MVIKIGRIAAIVALAFLSLLLQGCPLWVSTTIYNNTESDLVLKVEGGFLKWSRGTSLRIDKDIENRLQWIEKNGYSYPVLAVGYGDDNVVLYNLEAVGSALPNDYVGLTNGKWFSTGTRDYQLQLQPDHNLYIVKAKTGLPAKTLEPQPLGFPIKPH